MSLSIVCKCGHTHLLSSEAVGSIFNCDHCGRRLLASNRSPAPELDDSTQQQILKEIQTAHRLSGTKASNPAALQVSRLRMIRLHPWSSACYYSLLLIALAWYGVHLFGQKFAIVNLGLFSVLAMLIWLISDLPWAVIADQFKSGDTNPTKIIDVDSQLVAVYTDLRHRQDDNCLVIKILRQPIEQLIDGPAELNRRLVSASNYSQGAKLLDHWVDFRPRLVNAVARSQESIDRLEDSISESDWEKLDIGISQIPKPYTPGLYRIYSPEQIQYVLNRGPIEEQKITKAIEHFLGGVRGVQLAPNAQTKAEAFSRFSAPVDEPIVAIASWKLTTFGMLLTTAGCYWSEQSGNPIVVQWNDVLGALYTADRKVRITLSDLSNVTLNVPYRRVKLGVMLEQLCTVIGRL